jgi:hypothetical protein
VPAAPTIAGALGAPGDLALVAVCWSTEACSEVCSARRASSPLVSAWSGAPPHLSSDYAVLLAGLMLGVGTALYVIGQMLERLLKTRQTMSEWAACPASSGGCSRTFQRNRSAIPAMGRVTGGLGLKDVAPGPGPEQDEHGDRARRIQPEGAAVAASAPETTGASGGGADARLLGMMRRTDR